MVTRAHFDFAGGRINFETRERVNEFFLVQRTRFFERLCDKVGGIVRMERGESGRRAISILIRFDERLIFRRFGIIEQIVHRSHHAFGSVRSQRLEHRSVNRGVNPHRNLVGQTRRFGGLEYIGHARAAGGKNDRVGFGCHDGGQIRREVRLARFPPRLARFFHIGIKRGQIIPRRIGNSVTVFVIFARNPVVDIRFLCQCFRARLARHRGILARRKDIAMSFRAGDCFALGNPDDVRHLLLFGKR